ncbi:hypothetical protein Pfo_011433 [Paulownia fortunei]|nr:hypothetical protein Pfo_011433 [Paulownia fortunei]
MFKNNFLLLPSLLKFADAETWIRSGYWYSGSEFPFAPLHKLFLPIMRSIFHHLMNHTCLPSQRLLGERTHQPRHFCPSRQERQNLQRFFEMINQPSRRRSFIKSSITAARQHGFMGLDIFDVFPSTPANMANMENFLDEWREAINSEPKNSDTSPLILTMGAKYSPVLESLIYPINSINRNFDWVHILSFDYHLPSQDRFTGAHAALYDPSSNLNTDYGINEWIMVPNSYGVKPVFNSTYVVNYCKIGLFWFGYDDVEAVKTKVSYAKEKGLLGYSVFQIPNDDMNWILSRTG